MDSCYSITVIGRPYTHTYTSDRAYPLPIQANGPEPLPAPAHAPAAAGVTDPPPPGPTHLGGDDGVWGSMSSSGGALGSEGCGVIHDRGGIWGWSAWPCRLCVCGAGRWGLLALYQFPWALTVPGQTARDYQCCLGESTCA